MVFKMKMSQQIYFLFFSATITLSVVLGMLGFMFCVLVAFIIRRYRRFRYGNHRKFKTSDEDLVEENLCHDNSNESEQENELFNVRLHSVQQSILSPVSPEECDQDIIIQDSTVSSTSDQRLSLFLFFRKLLK